MTPNDLMVLLYHHCQIGMHPQDNSPAVKASHNKFVNLGCLIATSIAGEFVTTERGKALVAMLCDTPLPLIRPIDPRTGKEVKL